LKILYIEPFNTGSHALFTRNLTSMLEADWTALTLPGRNWKWRMRGSAAYLIQKHRETLNREYDLLVAGSYLPLVELKGLVPTLAGTPAVLYFHENQLAYPIRDGEHVERDLHFGFTQLVSALGATTCVFNSRYNMESFLEEAEALLRRMPDLRPPELAETVRRRSTVLPVPLDLPGIEDDWFEDTPPGPARQKGPVILWNHRWEHDKNPEAFFEALHRLAEESVPFRLIVCGERYTEVPPVFEDARRWLGDRVIHWGYAETRTEYERLLNAAHVAVSTALHEFFGVAVLEATHFGARPLVPDRLAYPEVFPDRFRYADNNLAEELTRLCRNWNSGKVDLKKNRTHIAAPYRMQNLLSDYRRVFEHAAASGK
jgi:glycosyltransferase involved in cell wall biosynthesis